MKVINQTGREMEMTRKEYDELVLMGVKLQILERELDEIVKTDNDVYTAICGEYSVKRNGIPVFRGDNIFRQTVMEAKRYKILPHLFFPDKEVTIWTDANIFIKPSTGYIITKMLGDADIAMFGHPYRHTVWEEFMELKRDPRFDIDWLQKQLNEQENHYSKEGLPKDTPLWECNFIIRRNNERVNRLMDAWWSQICRWQWRDQVSFPYVYWKYGEGLKIKTIEGNIRKHKFFKHVERWGE